MYEPGTGPDMYQAQGKRHDFPDMTSNLCPQCKGDYLRKHGFYRRDLRTLGFEGTILIRRYYCHVCKRTVSLLPSFCHPKRTYGLLPIFGVLAEFYIKMKTVCLTAMDYLAASGVEISRQLLRHYRRRIERNLNGLIMAVTAVYALRAPPVTENANIKTKVKQLLSSIPSPQDGSLKIFELTKTTYLTKQPN